MQNPSPRGFSTSNRLLATLSSEACGGFERVALSNGEVLIQPNGLIAYVWFPETGMISLVAPLEGGTMIEVGLVGNEGMVGTPVLLGCDRWPIEAIVQMPGSALRMSARHFLKLVDQNNAFRKLLLRHTQSIMFQTMQSAACNGQHIVTQRLARWLLMVHDRVDGADLKLSHEFISMMLGIRRAGVTVAVAAFTQAGVLSTSRGRITILDRVGLEQASCECYRSVTSETERLLQS